MIDYQTFRSRMTADVMTKLFFDAAEERYPSGEKIKQLVSRVADSVATDPIDHAYLQIALLNGLREMTRQVSPQLLYRSLQHRDDLYAAIVAASEDAEDLLDELFEESAEEGES